MTPAQSARLEGFLASLEVRGLPVSIKDAPSGTPSFSVLYEPAAVSGGPRFPEEGMAAGDRLHALRSHLPAGVHVGVGTVLVGADGARFVVASVEDSPGNLVVIFTTQSFTVGS